MPLCELRITNEVDNTLQAGVETTVTPDTIFSPLRESSTQVLLNYAVFLSAVGASAIAHATRVRYVNHPQQHP